MTAGVDVLAPCALGCVLNDESVPLLERVKFLAIWTSNLDEYFMVRVAGLHDQVDAGIDARGADGLSPSQTIAQIQERMAAQADRQGRQWEQDIRPALAENGIRIVDPRSCTGAEAEAIEENAQGAPPDVREEAEFNAGLEREAGEIRAEALRDSEGKVPETNQ